MVGGLLIEIHTHLEGGRNPLVQTSLHITRRLVRSCCLVELVGLKGLRGFDAALGFIMLRLAQRKALGGHHY